MFELELLEGYVGEPPAYQTRLSAGFDLVAQEDVIINPGQTVKIRTGVRIKNRYGFVNLFDMIKGYLHDIPESHLMTIENISEMQEPIPFLKILPRSSLSAQGINVATGTVDADYRGEIMVTMSNIKQFDVWDILQMAHHAISEERRKRLICAEHHAYDLRDHHSVVKIKKGARIAQAVCMQSFRVSGVMVKDVERGEGGFGSTDEAKENAPNNY